MRWALVAAFFLVACGGAFAAEENAFFPEEKETRQQKIDRLCSEEKWEEAEPYLVAEIASGKKGRPLAESLLQLALVLNSQSKWADAFEAADRARRMCGDFLNDPPTDLDDLPFHISTQRGVALFGMKRIADARRAFAEALAFAHLYPRNGGLGPDHEATAATLVHYANVYLAESKLKEARPHLQRAMVIFEERLGVDAPQTKEVREMLAKLNEQMRRAAVSAE